MEKSLSAFQHLASYRPTWPSDYPGAKASTSLNTSSGKSRPLGFLRTACPCGLGRERGRITKHNERYWRRRRTRGKSTTLAARTNRLGPHLLWSRGCNSQRTGHRFWIGGSQVERSRRSHDSRGNGRDGLNGDQLR